LEVARRTVQRVHDGSAYFLKWWDEYKDEEHEDEQDQIFQHLFHARDRAQDALAKIAEYTNALTDQTQSESFQEQTSHVTQDFRESLTDVFSSVEEFDRQLQKVKGWQKYKAEFEGFLRELNSYVIRAPEPAARRFPNPHQTRTYEYKMVQIRPTIAVQAGNHVGDEAARYLQAVVDEQTVDGWEFYRVDTLSVAVPSGCLAGLFGAGTAHDQYYVVTFRRSLGV